MKIFIGLRRFLPYLGVLDFNHPNGRLISAILRISIPASIIVIMVLTLWFICFEGNTFVEYLRALLALVFFFNVLFTYQIIAITRTSLLQLYDAFEAKVNERKCNFHESNIQVSRSTFRIFEIYRHRYDNTHHLHRCE